jgi:predicted RNase H-like nuclease (RuvC/YqgF family)
VDGFTVAEGLTAINELRERLTATLADWGVEVSQLLRELEAQRVELTALKAQEAEGEKAEQLKRQLEGQERLIDTLKQEAEESAALRREVRAKDLEIEQLKSELSSKRELIHALRRDAESVDRLKGDGKAKDQEIAQLQKGKQTAEHTIALLTEQVEGLKEAQGTHAEASELEAVRAELEARKTLIRSLRADAERATVLDAQLDEKRDVIAQLESSMNRHANTIAELKQNADLWKKKYQRLRGFEATVTSAQVPALTETDVRVFEAAQGDTTFVPDRTTAIDMRDALLKAKRAATGGRESES